MNVELPPAESLGRTYFNPRMKRDTKVKSMFRKKKKKPEKKKPC